MNRPVTTIRPATTQPSYAVVIPTLGAPRLKRLLESLGSQSGPAPREVILLDDRRSGQGPLPVPPGLTTRVPVRVLRSFGRGTAAARNLGWRVTRCEWVTFLDDDLTLPEGWAESLGADLEAADEGTGCVLAVRAGGGSPDLAYRRVALEEVHGFDERFRTADRAAGDAAARVRAAGWELREGVRQATPRPAAKVEVWPGAREQDASADDALMRRLHGRRWRAQTGGAPGLLPAHLAVTAAGAAGLVAGGVALRRGAPVAGRIALAAAATWVGLTARLASGRAPWRTRGVAHATAAAAVAAALAPPYAVWQRLRGELRHRGAGHWPPPVEAVFFDRDGTLVRTTPYAAAREGIEPLPGAAAALDRLRRNGVAVGVVTNQAAVGRGLVAPDELAATNAVVELLLGPFDTWQVCTHAPQEGCSCRKPLPELVTRAAAAVGVPPSRCAVIGDVGADLEAARAAGARDVLVPTAATRRRDVADAPVVARDLASAVDLVLDWGRR